jgi:hypothetical protein
MLWVGFEPTIPAFKRAKAFHALDREATVIGRCPVWSEYLFWRYEKLRAFSISVMDYISSLNYICGPVVKNL